MPGTEPLEGKMTETSNSTNIPTKLQRIAKLARSAPQMAFTTLAHHIDLEWLRAAYRQTRKSSAPGVDEVTAKEYAANLDANLADLLDRFKSGRYYAPPVRRVYIPKGDGKSVRPIGIPTFEDRVLQRAVTMVLEAVYEQDFLPCSFGFRRGRSQHQALADLRQFLMANRGGWVIDLDVSKFFDTLDHQHLRKILDQRVRDGVIRRVIGKWLKAGVLEKESLSYSETGTPQGGVISPMLSNIYLHEVLDSWFAHDVMPRLHGPAHLVRFADDAVIVVATEQDAQRLLEVLPKRMGRFGLTVHPEKTRLVPFQHPWISGNERPDTFNFLGFTLSWAKTAKGGWAVKLKTAKDRFKRALQRVKQWCQKHRHDPVRKQCRELGKKIVGHCQYYGVTGNTHDVRKFAWQVRKLWRKWLNRRSQGRGLTLEQFDQLLERYPLPPALCLRSVLRPVAKP